MAQRRILSPSSQLPAYDGAALDPRAVQSSSLRSVIESDGGSTVDELNREDEWRQKQEQAQAVQMQRQQQQQVREQAAAQKEAEDQQKRLVNSVQEAKLRTAGTPTYTDAFGNIQAVTDPMTGKPKQTDTVGKTEWDQSGRAYRIERKDGQVQQKFVDEAAEVGPNPEDPNDRYIYRKNTQAPWETIDPEHGIFSLDKGIRDASAKHLRSQQISALERERAKLKVDLAKLPAKSSRAFSTEEKEAQAARQKAEVRLAEIDAEKVGINDKPLGDFAKELQAKLGPAKGAEAVKMDVVKRKQNLELLQSKLAEEKRQMDGEAVFLDRKKEHGLTPDEMVGHAERTTALGIRQQAWAAKAANIQKLADQTATMEIPALPDKGGEKEAYTPAKLNEVSGSIKAEADQLKSEAAAFEAERKQRMAGVTNEATKQAFDTWQQAEIDRLNGRSKSINDRQLGLQQAHSDLISKEVETFAGILEKEAGKAGDIRKSWTHVADAEEQTAIRNEERRVVAGGEVAKEIREKDKVGKAMDEASRGRLGNAAAAIPAVQFAMRSLGIDDAAGLQNIMHRTAQFMRGEAVRKGIEAVYDG
ncbi:MAG: hypothetical protein KA004_05195, partial [Verrucomicrobiales bacterium]|nr:hypothetical protein [Verrucomicrobiales bacterium]